MTLGHQLDTDETEVRTQVSDFQDDAFTTTACSSPWSCFQGETSVSDDVEPSDPNGWLYAARSV